jgi:K+-transporting ATPase ATPase C chain
MNDKNTNLKIVQPTDEQPPAPSTDGMLTHLRVSVIATIVLAIIVCGIYPLIVWGLSQVMFHDKANGSLIKDASGTVIGSKLIGQNFSDAKYFHPRPSAAGNGYDPTASGGSNLGPTSKKLLNGTTKPTTLPTKLASGDYAPGPDAVDYDGIKLRVVGYCDDNNIAYELAREKKDDAGNVVERTVVDPKTFKTDKGDYDQVKLVNAFNDDVPLTIKAAKPVPADAVTASASGLDPHISVENAEIQIGRVAAARKMSPDAVRKLVAEHTDGRDLGILGEPGVNVLMLNIALDELEKP